MKLEIKNLIKKYNDVRALDGFSVTMTQGVYGLLGPNGAGKSTLMNILTDNLKRDDGEILYDGKEMNSIRIVFHSIAAVGMFLFFKSSGYCVV